MSAVPVLYEGYRLPVDERSHAERGEARAAGITGPVCPFCGSHKTEAMTEGWPFRGTSGVWHCNNCDERGAFDSRALYWLPEGDPSV
jgi:ribosomal protein L37AE/L43A